jgi:hypothetical protein
MWESPGDEGWRTAAAVSASTTQLEQVNEDGLPVRVPGRNLVPGSAQGSADLAASGPPVLRRDPTQQRALSSFQQGVQRARATGEAATRQDPGPGGPDDQEV